MMGLGLLSFLAGRMWAVFKEFVGFRDLLDEARGEGALQDGEQRVPVDGVHDHGGVGLGTVLELLILTLHLRLYCSREFTLVFRSAMALSLVWILACWAAILLLAS